MLIAKIQLTPSRAIFAEVKKVGPVRFDPRPDWILIDDIIGRTVLKMPHWIHPSEHMIVWIRKFCF